MTSVKDPIDLFRPEFKRYKSKATPPSLEDVVDTDINGFEKKFYEWSIPEKDLTCERKKLAKCVGLRPPDSWRCYAAHGYPGLQFIRNPFLPGCQRYWVERCLAAYSCKPNITNLDGHWPANILKSPWQAGKQTWSSGLSKGKTAVDQLRWVTLGYHYDWNDKVYHADRHSTFPADLALMSSVIAGVLGYNSFLSQAAIVNFYHMDSTLGGHTDHSEFDLSAPLISYSLGQSAILLVGGESKAKKPVAIHLRSGDVVILGGACRLAYHAVPRIMHATPDGELPQCFALPDGSQQSVDDLQQGSAASISKPNCEHTEGIRGAGCAVREIIDEGRSEPGANPKCLPENQDTLLSEDNRNRSASTHSRQTSSDAPSEEFSGQTQGSDTGLEHASMPKCPGPGWPADTVDRVLEGMQSAMEELARDEVWGPFREYLKNTRINISVRQVIGPGKGFPEEQLGGNCQVNHTSEIADSKKIKTEDR